MAQDKARRRALRGLARKAGFAAGAESGLLEQALTHDSYASEHPGEAQSNERLEFLGDAVLGAVVAAALHALHPQAGEGQLSRMRASLVSRTALARAAEMLGLSALVRLGKGESAAGGAHRPSVLAGTFEALVGAVFERGGMPAARRFVERHHLAHAASSAASDPKTALQEYAQAKFKKAPHYAVTAVAGPPHERTFTVAVDVGGQVLGSGNGATKKQAQARAAREALAHLP